MPTPDPLRWPAKHLWIGLTAWLAWFALVYGGVSVACRVEPVPGWINAAVLLATLAAAAPLAGAAWVQGRRARRQPRDQRQGFIGFTSTALYATAAIATLAVGAPAVLLPACV